MIKTGKDPTRLPRRFQRDLVLKRVVGNQKKFDPKRFGIEKSDLVMKRVVRDWPRRCQRDLVLKRVVGNQKKFDPNWEGPFEIAKSLSLGFYILR